MKEIFKTVPENSLFGIVHDGRYDYRKTAKLLNLNRRSVAKGAGVSEQSVRYDERMPEDLKKFFMDIISMLSIVSKEFDGSKEKTIAWFKMPNPLLGGRSPIEMICLGKQKKLMKLIERFLRGESP